SGFGEQAEYSFRRDCDRGRDGLIFVGLERREDVVRNLRLVFGPTDADLHAPDGFRPERLDDGLHAVVAAGAALESRPDLAKLQLHVAVGKDEVFGPGAELAADAAYGGPADVHEGLRLDQIDGVAAPGAARHERARSGMPRLLELVREEVDDALADIV